MNPNRLFIRTWAKRRKKRKPSGVAYFCKLASCGRLYYKSRHRHSFCSPECAKAHARMLTGYIKDVSLPGPRPDQVINAPCLQCGKVFQTTKSTRICQSCTSDGGRQSRMRTYHEAALIGGRVVM